MIAGSINIGVGEVPADFFACVRDSSLYDNRERKMPHVSYTEAGRKFVDGKSKSLRVRRVESMWRQLILKSVAEQTRQDMMAIAEEQGILYLSMLY
jgi:hypothetical protein